MPRRLDSRTAGFAAAFAALVDDAREEEAGVSADVARIIADVRADGAAAVRRLTLAFDRVDLDALGWRIDPALIRGASASVPADVMAALTLAARRIEAFHAAQRPADLRRMDEAGALTGYRWRPVDSAGLYVPGGRAAYPSSLLMNIIPARVAGVGRIVIATPTPGGEINPLVLAAAHLTGVDEIYRVGGAQAIAALALGGTPMPRVDVITGPGNAWVAEAKRQLFGRVGIDMIAGPSEILVIADAANEAAHIAADLLSQAEHDPLAQSILITDDTGFADAVEAAVIEALTLLPEGSPAHASWRDHGVVITVADLEAEAPVLANALAAEHVEICLDDPEPWLDRIVHAGSIFLGRMTPEPVGDYVAGPNHVLPTGRRARFSSGLSVMNFMKRTTFLGCDAAALAAIGPAAATLARVEGLPAHALAIDLRLPHG